jgi:sugar phosphate isomerase/epimerase
MTANRRQFLRTAVAAGAGAALAAPATAIEPIKRHGKSHLRLSIAGYSYRKYLDPKKKEMSYYDFIDAAAEMGTDAVELTQYYFPEVLSQSVFASLKGRATRQGLDVSGTAVGNTFTPTDPDKLRAQVRMVKEWSEYTALLGGKTMRIFAGNLEKGDTEEKARGRVVEAIHECCDYAARYGVYLALENHGGIVATIDQMLALVKAVKHDWFGVNFDTGNFHSADPYADLTRLAPYAVVCQIKTEIKRAGSSKPEEADLKRLTDILRAADFRGYVALEYEAEEDPKTGVPRAIEALKKLMG